jgi:ankyrin repeat protein
MFAARQGSSETAERLLAAGANVNASEPQYGFTALQTAIFNGHYQLAARLADRGADVNDGSLYTALETRNLATYSNRPNPPDNDNGVTSLDLIQALLAHGADPNQPYTKKIPPRQAQGDINAARCHALSRHEPPTSWRSARCSIRARTRTSPRRTTTPLMVATGFGARRGNEEDVVEKPAAPSARRHQALRGSRCEGQRREPGGNTALHCAALTGSTRSVEYLAASGRHSTSPTSRKDTARPGQSLHHRTCCAASAISRSSKSTRATRVAP